MADILKPTSGQTPITTSENNSLQKDNYLGEFATKFEKELVRGNLEVPSADSVYDKESTQNEIQGKVRDAMQSHLSVDDPHGILPQVDNALQQVIRTDGSTPFVKPQQGVDPVFDYHLTTKRFVNNLIEKHLAESDPHNIMEEVISELKNYVLYSQVYLKPDLYTKGDIQTMLTKYVKEDGSTAFKRPVLGIDPTVDSHLSTKKYVDRTIQGHLVEVDPHGFLTTLNKRLAQYSKRSDTYSKQETYSRQQIDDIIIGLVQEATQAALEDHINQYDPHNILDTIQNKLMKRDGSVPFTQPQAGVEATQANHLVTLRQLQEATSNIQTFATADCCTWITSGPVEKTVGYVEEGTSLSEVLTLQEIMDLIFYGKDVTVESPDYAYPGTTVDVTICVRGGGEPFTEVKLYQNGVLIGTYYPEDFGGGACITVPSQPIIEDTTFHVDVEYENVPTKSAESTTLISYGIFIGLLPKFYDASRIQYDYLLELVKLDPVNNKLIGDKGSDLSVETMEYNFSSPGDPRHIFVAEPQAYPQLKLMETPTQAYPVSWRNPVNQTSFDIIETNLTVPGATNNPIAYNIYVFRQANTVLEQLPVTFNFE